LNIRKLKIPHIEHSEMWGWGL